MKYVLIIFFLSASCFGQVQKYDCPEPVFCPEHAPRDLSAPDAVYYGNEVKTAAHYGINALLFYDFIAKSIDTAQLQIPKGFKGKVYISFIVEKNGSLTDIKLLREPYPGLGAALINVIRKSPAWIPAINNEGATVRMLYAFPYLYKN